MNDEILKRIDLLAAKLGVTVDHLWGVLIRQARIDGIEWVAWGCLWFVLAAGLGVWMRVIYKREDGDGDTFITVALFATGFVLVGLFCLSNTLGLFLNPEYWALKQVTAMLCGK